MTISASSAIGLMFCGCSRNSSEKPKQTVEPKKSERVVKPHGGELIAVEEVSVTATVQDIAKNVLSCAPDQMAKILAKMSVAQLRELLSSGHLATSDRAAGIVLAVFADRAGAEGSEQDLEIILNCSCPSAQVGKALEKYFDALIAAGRVDEVVGMLDNINPGLKRDMAIGAYFSNATISLDNALAMADHLSFPEDRKSVLIGLSKSRVWMPSGLVSLTQSSEDIQLLKLFLSRGVRDSVLSGTSNWAEDSWADIANVVDPSTKEILANSLFEEIGIRNPNKALTLLSKLPEIEARAILSNPQAASVIASWSDRDPVNCLNYVVSAGLDDSVTERLVSKGFGQWLMVDSIAASKWLGSNVDKPYSRSSIDRLIRWLEQRGENADVWKNALKDVP